MEYPGSAPYIYQYLSYQKLPDPKDPGAELSQVLEAHKTYTLNIMKSPGVTFKGEAADQGWDESEDYVVIVDVEKFLWAATHGEGYFEGDEEILRQIDGGTRLIRNISLEYKIYDAFAPREEANHSNTWWTPDMTNILFDGGKHYIWKVGSPIFNKNQGTIQNLGIKNVRAEIASRDSFKDEMTGDALDGYLGFDLSSKGIVCNHNDNGTISNVRIVDADKSQGLIYNLKSYTSTSQNSQSHGFVVGLNTGNLTNVAIEGNIVMTITKYDGSGFYDKDEDYNIEPSNQLPGLNVGGIVGQNTGTGLINQVAPIENMSIRIVNKCVGEKGGYYFGGIVGSGIGGTIMNVTLPKIEIDGSQSIGNISYMGGMAGQLPDARSSSVNSCNVIGSILAGTTVKVGDIDAKAYAGGIAGLTTPAVEITNCNTVVDVTGGDIGSPNTDVRYATGGVFGMVNTTEFSITNIENIIANGNILKGAGSEIGSFAGVAPGDLWENIFNNNINIRQFKGISIIGNTL